MVIKEIEPCDIEELTKLHKLTFDKSHFSSTFPTKILNKYFDELLKHNEFKLAAVQDNLIVGYLIAGFNPDLAVKSFMKKNTFQLLYVLLLNPSFLFEKIREIFKRQTDEENIHHKNISVYLIAVKKEKQNLGIGKKLLDHFERLLSERKLNCYTLAVRKNNVSAIKFYLNFNFIEISRDHKTISFIKNLK